jgi:hypothetical protein
MQTISEATRSTPVVREVDVLVAGGGVGGVTAAIAAARAGADVLLIERYGYLGGIVTGWPVPLFYTFSGPGLAVVQGIPLEVIQRLRSAGAYEPFPDGHPNEGAADSEYLKWLCQDMLEEAGVEILLHSWVVGVVKDGNAVTGVIVENKSGRQALLGKVAVDATGDADLAWFAGADFETREGYGDIETGNFGRGKMKHSLGVRFEGIDTERARAFQEDDPERWAALKQQVQALGGDLAVDFRSRSVVGDAIDAWDLTRMELETRRKLMVSLQFLRENVAGYENALVVSTSPQFGVREGRRIIGVDELREVDKEAGVVPPDTVSCGWARKAARPFGIPYGCLVPEKVDGLLVAGRTICMEPQCSAYVRLIGQSMGIAHAAGAAAGLAARQSRQPRALDVAELRALLSTQGAYLHDGKGIEA